MRMFDELVLIIEEGRVQHICACLQRLLENAAFLVKNLRKLFAAWVEND